MIVQIFRIKLNVLSVRQKHVTEFFSIHIRRREINCLWKRNEKEAKIDIRSDSWFKRRQTKSKNKRQKNKKHQYLRIADLKWYEEKEKKKKKKWEKKWNYIDEKMNDWNAERKMNDWDANFEMNAGFLRRNNTWLTASDETVWWETKSYDFDITSMMKSLMMNLIIWLMILSVWIVNDIRRWYDYLDDASWCYHLWHETRIYVCDKTSDYLIWAILTIYTI